MKPFHISDDRRHQLSGIAAFILVASVVVTLVAVVLVRFGHIVYGKPYGYEVMDAAVKWFDPSFFVYNLLLCAFAVLIVPFLTIHYVVSMRREKMRRLTRELCGGRAAGSRPETLWGENEPDCERNIRTLIRPQFRLLNYLPSMIGMSATVAFGISILLLAKPVFVPPDAANHLAPNGVNYAVGANMLLLGPKVAFYSTSDPATFRQVLTSLCAFQFGFLGAFVYAISSLVWSYFNVDLTPHTLVAGSVRMVTASVVSLVLSFFIPFMPAFKGNDSYFVQMLPVAAFFLGYFPDRALVLLQRAGGILLQLKTDYASLPMHYLPGIGISDEGRLSYEGFSNLEQVEHSDPLDLAIRTGYSYTQLNSWREQAWLASRLREQYPKWILCTGILGRDDLMTYFQREARRVEDAIGELSAESGVPKVKLRALYLLLCEPVDEPIVAAQAQTLSASGDASKTPTTPIVDVSPPKV